MIAQLTGLIDQIEADRCVVDVNGVGYLVQASTRTLAALPPPPAITRLLIETLVREDAILLFGFADTAEREWFRLLTTVQGVGARVALNILSALSPRDLVAAIAAGDRASLTRAPGVGAKLAIRLLSELRDKVGGMPLTATASGAVFTAPQTPDSDAISAMLNLGYRRPEAQAAVERAVARLGEAATLDRIIRDALKELVPKELAPKVAGV